MSCIEDARTQNKKIEDCIRLEKIHYTVLPSLTYTELGKVSTTLNKLRRTYLERDILATKDLIKTIAGTAPKLEEKFDLIVNNYRFSHQELSRFKKDFTAMSCLEPQEKAMRVLNAYLDAFLSSGKFKS
jgi:hypothetical protein